MNTFDSSVKYLSDIDFKKYDIFSDTGYKDFVPNLNLIYLDFEEKGKHKEAYSHYRGAVFATAIQHLAFKANGIESCFDKACQIVESEKHILSTNFKKFAHTVYPQIMMDKWEEYCSSLNPTPDVLKGEMMTKILFVAYSYILEPDLA